MDLTGRLLRLRHVAVLGKVSRLLLMLLGVDIPAAVTIGKGLHLQHRGVGVVLSPFTVIGDRVTIFHGVTVGRKDSVERPDDTTIRGRRIVIDDDAWLMPGCVVLGGEGETRVGKRTVIAPNAVLLQSTGDDEVWGGVPARRLR